MPITGVDSHLQAAYETTFAIPFRRNPFSVTASSTLLVIKNSTWAVPGFPGPGSIPATGAGAACDRNTSGAMPLPTAVVGKKIYLNYFNILSVGQPIMELHDRMVHTAGLNANITTEQVVNSVALPSRATGGLYVVPHLESYVAAGATVATVTLKYTNQDGVTGKTANTSSVSLATANRLIPLNLAAGDKGVRVVESVTLGAATGAVGNFGITLSKLKAWAPVAGANFTALPQNPTEQGGSTIEDDACLMVVGLYNGAATTLVDGMISFIQALSCRTAFSSTSTISRSTWSTLELRRRRRPVPEPT